MRRRLGLLAAVFLLVPLLAAALPGRGIGIRAAAAQEAISCADFTRPEAAQALLDADDGYAGALDPDGDGEACTDADLEILETAIPELENRFGGPRILFEREYGDPVGDEDAAWPDGAEYDVDGFREVSVFYHADYAAYITLSAERRAPFSQAEAEEIVLDFLPEDFEQEDEPTETEDGDLLIGGHSDALEDRFGAGTYERYGASGEPGDVFFVLRLDADNDVSAIEIGLGLEEQTGPETEEDDEAEPTPEPEDEDAEPTPEPQPEDEAETLSADEYVETVTGEVETLLGSIDDFFALIGSETFGDDASIDQLTTTLTLWSGAAITAAEITPPDGFEDAHELYLEFTDLLLTASTDFLLGISGDDASLTSAGEALNDAQTTGQTLLTVLEGA